MFPGDGFSRRIRRTWVTKSHPPKVRLCDCAKKQSPLLPHSLHPSHGSENPKSEAQSSLSCRRRELPLQRADDSLRQDGQIAFCRRNLLLRNRSAHRRVRAGKTIDTRSVKTIDGKFWGVMGAASTDGLRSRRLQVRSLPGILSPCRPTGCNASWVTLDCIGRRLDGPTLHRFIVATF